MKKLLYLVLVLTALSLSAEGHAQKKWSSKAKGTAIGAGAGAVTGAILHKKNRTTGGIVGGVIGGGIGYMYGRRKDKKREEARIAAVNRAAASRAAEATATRYPVYSSYRRSGTTTSLNSTGNYSALGDESYETYYNRRKSW